MNRYFRFSLQSLCYTNSTETEFVMNFIYLSVLKRKFID